MSGSAARFRTPGRYPSGHWYFTLKDPEAQISCVCFRRDARYLRTKPEDGLAVVAGGRVDVYGRQGKYQLYIEALEPQGRGALHLEFERLKARLQEEGLFEQGRKRPLPALPQRVGIVTSRKGAVIADMVRIMERRFPGLWIRLYPVRVQGPGAAAQIAAGVRFFSERPWAEVVIVGRGGGSLEDLWAFNEETVARAIAASSIPVVSAVGHQTDFTISDFVADVRAATPSAAAELAVPEAKGLILALHEAEERAARAMRLRLTRLGARVLRTSLERAARTVEGRINDAWQALDAAAGNMNRIQESRIRRAGRRLERTERRLAGLDLRVRFARQSERLRSVSQRLLPAIRQLLDRRASRLATLGGEPSRAESRRNPGARLRHSPDSQRVRRSRIPPGCQGRPPRGAVAQGPSCRSGRGHPAGASRPGQSLRRDRIICVGERAGRHHDATKSNSRDHSRCGRVCPGMRERGSAAHRVPRGADQPLPEFSLQILDGAVFTNEDLDGKVALINFWATWCGPCKIEMPWFVEFQRKYKDKGFTVLAISLDEEGWDPVRVFAEQMEFNFPVALGDDPVSEDFGGIYVLPTTLIVDRSGTIVSRHTGLVPKAAYETEIEDLL